MHYRLTQAAENDVIRLLVEGGNMFGVVQAEQYYYRLLDAFESIASFPLSSPVVTENDPVVRLRPFAAHVILYTVIDDRPLILAVRHAREDWTRWV